MYELVVVGTSLGGLNALEALLGALPAGFPLPLAIVQHRSIDSKRILINMLQRRCALRVREPNDKEPIRSGCCYVAPPDYHLLVEDGTFALSTDPPVSYARPSIDVLFHSAADEFGPAVIAVVLTGASKDGAAGVARIKQFGGVVVVQDPATAESPVMPRAAIAAAPVDQVLSIPEIARFLVTCGESAGG